MVYTERDVRREVEAAKVGLEHGSDWQRWVSSMRRLAGAALGGGGSEFPALLVGLVRASVHEMVGHKVRVLQQLLSVFRCRGMHTHCCTYIDIKHTDTLFSFMWRTALHRRRTIGFASPILHQ